MENFNYFIFARSFHVIGVVLWIGGMAFVTTVLIPALKKRTDSTNKLELFEQIEGEFAVQAKLATVITGISGFYMLDVMNAWERYQQLEYWWMHLMTLIWFLFTLVLFVLEPLFLHRWFHQQAEKNSIKAFALVHQIHKVLLALSLLTVFGAVAGAHGFHWFN
ncbi:MAG: hypothetical protein M0R41_14605 [Methylobacter tundripaludum]|jgi:uncharacterized membrane protein|nr:hypothetical protein [Methylobacter tundripaludum]